MTLEKLLHFCVMLLPYQKVFSACNVQARLRRLLDLRCSAPCQIESLELRFTICSSPTSFLTMTLQLSILRGASAPSSELRPPIFLAPLLASISQPLHQRFSFSTTAALSVRAKKKRDGNNHRGESALRRTGLKYGNSMSKQPLPRPVLDPEKRTKIQVDPNHGLWGFFNSERKALSTLEQEKAKGILHIFYIEARQLNRCRSSLDRRRATAQVLGRLTFAMVHLLQGAKQNRNRVPGADKNTQNSRNRRSQSA